MTDLSLQTCLTNAENHIPCCHPFWSTQSYLSRAASDANSTVFKMDDDQMKTSCGLYIYIYKNKNIYYLTNQHIFLKIGKHSCSFVFDSVFVALFSCSNVFSDSDASCCGNFRPSPTPPPPSLGILGLGFFLRDSIKMKFVCIPGV